MKSALKLVRCTASQINVLHHFFLLIDKLIYHPANFAQLLLYKTQSLVISKLKEEFIALFRAVQSRGGSNGEGGAAPSKNSGSLCVPPMKFMIKHNLPLVSGGSLWQ